MKTLPSVFLLGPSRWASNNDDERTLRLSPLEVRRATAAYMRRSGAPTVLLEDQVRPDDEDHFQVFLDTINHYRVRSFVLFWPMGARLHGLDVEIGHILTRIHEKEIAPQDVYLLAEKRHLGHTLEGMIAWAEPGNRTRYHEDLVAAGCNIRRWSTPRTLRVQAQSIAMDHKSRMAPPIA